MLKKSTVAALKTYFEKEKDIVLAFIFGSFAKKRPTDESDLDIAVYLMDKSIEEKVWSDVSRITKKEVDLITINEAPATLISQILKTGLPLVIKDKHLYWKLFLEKTLEAEDFAQFAKEYWDIYSRSQSLGAEDKARLVERTQFLKEEYKEIEKFKKLGFNEYLSDKIKRRNIERWAENIINATIDVAKIILASQAKKAPRTYEEALRDFGYLVRLKEKEMQQFSSFARLRNILAHEYLEIVFEKIQDFIKKSPVIYKEIFDFLAKFLKTKK